MGPGYRTNAAARVGERCAPHSRAIRGDVLPLRKRATAGTKNSGRRRIARAESVAIALRTANGRQGRIVEGGVEQRPNGDWRSHAHLTKGDVDTHLFVSFACEKPLDLRNTICLVVDSTVPEGQGAPTPLRIIVQDAHGAEYIANTDRPLNTPGSVRCFVPLDQFERAGWNQASHSSFDWSAVTTVRVGWGGYLGTQGETIEFTLSALHVARLADSLVHP